MEKVQRYTKLAQNKEKRGQAIILPEGTIIEITKRTMAHNPPNP